VKPPLSAVVVLAESSEVPVVLAPVEPVSPEPEAVVVAEPVESPVDEEEPDWPMSPDS
jgi:hypothetical protein